MIDRYSREKMKSVWSDKNKFDCYLKIELLNAEALHDNGLISSLEMEKLRNNSTYLLEDIVELENQLKHDVIAFTRAVSKHLGNEKRWIHYGLTSTDVVDTANGIRLKQANEMIEKEIVNFMDVLKNKANLYKNTFCIGRTHGIHADVTVFGLKWALWYDEMNRNLHRFQEVRKEVEIGKISGAVGNYAFTAPEIEDYICSKLGLSKPNISTQTLQRDRYAHYISVLAILGSTLDKIATEIRHLQRTEVGEVQEAFSKSQKGSSAMPHKKNPISSENISGLSRVLRGYVFSAMEDITLWHERDISHSSVERIILPDATCLIDYMLSRYSSTLDNLVVNEEKMRENIYLTNGIIFAQRVLTSLIEKGMSREAAYDLIQPITQKAYAERLSFEELLMKDENILSYLNQSEIKRQFTLDFYSKKVDYIYKRVF
ncbi:MAG: adenylosuccinate lyase [Firmicutes bacterium]|nr:adenylosuccinate lyase [Bacillota bacterium]